MKILHTADWHLGAKTDDLDRLEEQKDSLNQIIKIANDNAVDMVIIAGDVYEQLIPSAEAENLFYKTVSELSDNGNRAVVVIAGNHDEPRRMSNASIFASRFNIYLVGYYDEIKISNISKLHNIYPTECGTGYIKFETKSKEKCTVALLPYPSYYRYKATKESDTETFNQVVSKWINVGASHFEKDENNILVAHINCYGQGIDSSEWQEYLLISDPFSAVEIPTLDVGAGYVALGHIHGALAVNKSKNMYYSGALNNLFFAPKNDTDKSVNIVEMKNNQIVSFKQETIKVKKLRSVEVKTLDEVDKFCQKYPFDYIRASMKGVKYVNYEEIKELRKNNPNLVTLSVITAEALDLANVETKKDLTNSEIFDKFCLAKTGSLPKPEVKEMFLELMGGNLYETNQPKN